MNFMARSIAIVSILTASGLALAGPPETEKPKQTRKVEDALPAAAGQAPTDQRALMRQFRAIAEERNKSAARAGGRGPIHPFGLDLRIRSSSPTRSNRSSRLGGRAQPPCGGLATNMKAG